VPDQELGLVMAYAEMAHWCGSSPQHRARDPARGAHFDAAEAKEKGLVSRVVADDQWPRKCAPRPSASPTVSAGRALAQEVRTAPGRRRRTHGAGNRRVLRLLDTEDFRIGYSAFLAKKKPEFVGR